MAGHRDDGTFAEDKAHHPNRKVGRPSIRQDGASSQDFLKYGPPCDYCNAGAGQPCKDECPNHPESDYIPVVDTEPEHTGPVASDQQQQAWAQARRETLNLQREREKRIK